jgi:hypothetical protein
MRAACGASRKTARAAHPQESIMSRVFAVAMAAVLLGCSGGYAVRPVARIAADNVGRPVGALQEVFGEPRKIERSATRETYVWFLPQQPANGSSSGFHGCEMEVSVDPYSQRVLGFSLSNIGWSSCSEVERRIRVASR